MTPQGPYCTGPFSFRFMRRSLLYQSMLIKRINSRLIHLAVCLAAIVFFLYSSTLYAAPKEDILKTRHNLSVSGTGEVRANTENRVCVFCHTPHSVGNSDYQPPLWNRELSKVYYDVYQSPALQAGPLGQPDGTSRLCLSCHDGTIAIGKVYNLWGQSQTIAMSGTAGDGTMPHGVGEQSGFTRRLGSSLSNDHPVSFSYDAALAAADGELSIPPNLYVRARKPGEQQASLPLDEFGKLQCTTCHNPHLANTDKFLRWPLTQTSDTAANGPGAILCLQCHDKQSWIGSAHQSATIANEQYTPGNYLGKEGPVWQHACLNCHDTHTVQGAKHLLKEGTDSPVKPKAGGNPAQEETCYLCHSSAGESVISVNQNQPPNIKSEFSKTYHMPITGSEQGVIGEVHQIQDANLSEQAGNLGTQRHVECSDCHNPHRAGPQRHNHNAPHSNLIEANSPLNGMWGIEPSFNGPTAFPAIGQPILSLFIQLMKPANREYQICLKCHSSYAYGENPPLLKSFTGGGSYGINEITQSTDQAKEFNPNNASYHPVIQATNRSLAARNITGTSPFLEPFSSVGSQTMYCTDCHGADTPVGTSTPLANTPWGPHGSNNAFVLKGRWDINESPPNSSWLCFRCHSQSVYANPTGGDAYVTGFRGNTMMQGIQNLHRYHYTRLGSQFKCALCHSAVPHGWNGNPANPLYGTANYAKALLVERDDPQPYRTSATRLLVDNWANSGSWTFNSCKTAMKGGNLRGQTWTGCGKMGGGGGGGGP